MKTHPSTLAKWRHSLQRMVSWLGPKRLERWATRDAALIEQWWAAYNAHDYATCQRLLGEMRDNWDNYRDAS